jgi:hypothetical protein
MTLKGIEFRGLRYDIVIDRDAQGRVRSQRKTLRPMQ